MSMIIINRYVSRYYHNIIAKYFDDDKYQMNKQMYDSWQDKILGEVISILGFESSVSSIPSETEKFQHTRKMVGSAPITPVSSLCPFARLTSSKSLDW